MIYIETLRVNQAGSSVQAQQRLTASEPGSWVLTFGIMLKQSAKATHTKYKSSHEKP